MKRGQKIRIGRIQIRRCDSPRSKPGAPTLGPMGGGWRWKVGVLGGRREWIIELVYFQYRVTLLPRGPRTPRGPRPKHWWVDEAQFWSNG